MDTDVKIVKTRFEAEELMGLSYSFKCTRNMLPYNRQMLNFYMEKYKYKRTKLDKGIDLYEPIKIHT